MGINPSGHGWVARAECGVRFVAAGHIACSGEGWIAGDRISSGWLDSGSSGVGLNGVGGLCADIDIERFLEAGRLARSGGAVTGSNVEDLDSADERDLRLRSRGKGTLVSCSRGVGGKSGVTSLLRWVWSTQRAIRAWVARYFS